MIKILLLTIALVGCATPPAPAPTDPTSCRDACSNLAKLGCPEGLAANCESTCKRASDEGLTDLRPSCLREATSQEEARSCGTVTCGPR
jgi:hypothetical protein